jgi:hypothetical protein
VIAKIAGMVINLIPYLDKNAFSTSINFGKTIN